MSNVSVTLLYTCLLYTSIASLVNGDGVFAHLLDSLGNLRVDRVVQLFHVIDCFGKEVDLISHSISTSSASFSSASEIPRSAIASWVAFGEGGYAPVAHVKHGPKQSGDQMPRDHHFIGSDAVQQGARHGLNSNISVTHPPLYKSWGGNV